MLHVLCGIPGSGKTTLSKQLTEAQNAVLYCYDKIPYAHYPRKQEAVRNRMYSQIADNLANGKNVVCDHLHITKTERHNVLAAVSHVACRKVLHVMQTPLCVCIERVRNRERFNVPEDAIEICARAYEDPSLDEGWDEIIYHTTPKEAQP